MPWNGAKIEELYRRVTGVVKRTYRPLDQVPFFRFLYPPEAEVEVLREFRLFVQRLRANNFAAGTISLVEVLQAALMDLLNASVDGLAARLKEYEQRSRREELTRMLAEHLPEALTGHLRDHLDGYPELACVVLTRSGALFPFVRLSSVFSRLEGKAKQVIVALYPGDQEGAMLRDRSFDLAAGYYRGEVL